MQNFHNHCKDISGISFQNRLLYSSGIVSHALKEAAMGVFILFYYKQVLGLSGTLTGLAIAISIIWDGISDPMIGAWSDRLRSRIGRRHPLMIAAGRYWSPSKGRQPRHMGEHGSSEMVTTIGAFNTVVGNIQKFTGVRRAAFRWWKAMPYMKTHSVLIKAQHWSRWSNGWSLFIFVTFCNTFLRCVTFTYVDSPCGSVNAS